MLSPEIGRVVAESSIVEHWVTINPVDIPWGQLDHVLSWCRETCQWDWRWTQTQNSHYKFWFQDRRDAMTFRLRWF